MLFWLRVLNNVGKKYLLNYFIHHQLIWLKKHKKTNFLKLIMFFYTKVLTLFTKGVYLIDQLGPTYKQLQTGVREKEKEETKGESVTKSRR